MVFFRYWAIQHFRTGDFVAGKGEIGQEGLPWTQDQAKALRFACPGDAMCYVQNRKLLSVLMPVAIDIDR